jgi:hypothetical protein
MLPPALICSSMASTTCDKKHQQVEWVTDNAVLQGLRLSGGVRLGRQRSFSGGYVCLERLASAPL